MPLTAWLKSERAHGSPSSTCDVCSLSSPHALSYSLHKGKLSCIALAGYSDQVTEIRNCTGNIDRILPAPLFQTDLVSASNRTSVSASISIKHLSASTASAFRAQKQSLRRKNSKPLSSRQAARSGSLVIHSLACSEHLRFSYIIILLLC